MKKKELNTSALKRMREQLPHGSLRIIAERSGLAYFKVVNTFNGKSVDLKVIETALEFLEQSKAEESILANRIHALVG